MMQFTTVSNLFCKGTTFCRHSQGNSQLMFAFTALRDEIENKRTASATSKAVLNILKECRQILFHHDFLTILDIEALLGLKDFTACQIVIITIAIIR